MKKLLIILLATCGMSLYAEDTIPAIISTDTLLVTTDTISCIDSTFTAVADTLIDLPIFFDEALAWLDTTECTSDTLIAELPDSV